VPVRCDRCDRGLGYLGRIAVIGNAGDAMLENHQLGASAGVIARSGLGKAIAFKNGQASKLPIHSREIFKEAIARSGLRCDRLRHQRSFTLVLGSCQWSKGDTHGNDNQEKFSGH
jgi:hypothetical protein